MKTQTSKSVSLVLAAGVGLLSAVSVQATQWQSAITAAGPTVWYQFSETSGTTAADSAGGDQNGTYYNQATANDTTGVTLGVVGAEGGAATFDGLRGLLRATSVPVGQSFTVEVLAKSVPANWDAYAGLGTSADPNGFALHPYPAGNNVQGYVRNSSGGFDFSAFPSLTPAAVSDAFHLYVLTYDNSTGQLKLYIDTTSNLATFGTIPTRTSGLNTIDIAHDQSQSLAFPTDDRFSNITVDEWVLYNYALTSSQVAAQYGAFQADTIPEPSSVALLAFGGLILFRRRSASYGKQGRRQKNGE